jgi:hypothetical protein
MRLSRKLLYDDATQKTELLSSPVCDLSLDLYASRLGPCIERSLEDARALGLTLEPYFYLSDGYGCVQGTANIGVGFWDADELLREIHKEARGYNRDEMDLVLLLKHEIGHAFCYVHKLFQLPEFRKVFRVRGNFFATYPDHDRYAYDPYSVDHVNPDHDHYAQKHPDDDFAETFATFLDPEEEWRVRYRRRPGALRKIAFVEKLVQEYGDATPVVEPGSGMVDVPCEEIRKTVAQFFGLSRRRYLRAAQGFIDDDLLQIFRKPGRLKRRTERAGRLLTRNRQFIETSVTRRVRPKDAYVVSDLLEKIRQRLRFLKLIYLEEEEGRKLSQLHGLVLHKTLLFKLFNIFREP